MRTPFLRVRSTARAAQAIGVGIAVAAGLTWAALSGPGPTAVAAPFPELHGFTAPRVVVAGLPFPPGDVAAAADPRGRLHVLFTDGPARSGRLVHAVLGPDGEADAHGPLPGRFAGAKGLSLAAGADGSVHAVWQAGEAGSTNVFYAAREGGRFSPPTPLHEGAGIATSPALALDAAGRVHAVFALRRPRGGRGLEHRVREGGAFRPGAPIPAGGEDENAYAPRLAAREGGLALAWQASEGHLSRVRLVLLDARGEAPSRPFDLTPSPAGMGAYLPDLASEGAGLRVVWQDTARGLPEIATARLSGIAGGPQGAAAEAVGPAAPGAPLDGAFEPRVAPAGGGRTGVVWREGPRAERALRGAFLGAAGAEAPETLAAPARGGGRIRAHAVAPAAGGGVHVVWVEACPDGTARVLWRGPARARGTADGEGVEETRR